MAHVNAPPQSDTGTQPVPRYWAFISYSQRDKKWGQWLVHALETYRIPKQLIGRKTTECVVPARLSRHDLYHGAYRPRSRSI